MSEANNQDRLYEQLMALTSRAAYVIAHDCDASKPVGTRLIAIDDLRDEVKRAALLLREILESGGYKPVVNKTQKTKHAGISDLLGTVPRSNVTTSLDACPPGLFYMDGSLGFKTEYRDTNGPEAYCVESGEYWWGGTSDKKVRRKQAVSPIQIVLNKHRA